MSLFFVTLLSVAQETQRNSGLFLSIEARRINTISYHSDLLAKTKLSDMPSANSLRATLGYFINPRISLGANIGLENQDTEGNTCPVALDVRGYLMQARNTPFLYFNAGVLLKASDTFEKGNLLESGIGYKFFISRKFCMNASLGYNLRYFADSKISLLTYDPLTQTMQSDIVNNPMTYHSITFGLGLFF